MKQHITTAIQAGLIGFVLDIGFLDWEFYALIIAFSFLNYYYVKTK